MKTKTDRTLAAMIDSSGDSPPAVEVKVNITVMSTVNTKIAENARNLSRPIAVKYNAMTIEIEAITADDAAPSNPQMLT